MWCYSTVVSLKTSGIWQEWKENVSLPPQPACKVQIDPPDGPGCFCVIVTCEYNLWGVVTHQVGGRVAGYLGVFHKVVRKWNENGKLLQLFLETVQKAVKSLWEIHFLFFLQLFERTLYLKVGWVRVEFLLVWLCNSSQMPTLSPEDCLGLAVDNKYFKGYWIESCVQIPAVLLSGYKILGLIVYS